MASQNLPGSFQVAAARGADLAHRIDRSIAFMTAHPNKPLQVAKLAGLAGISPSHFFAVFKKRTGFAPMDFFTRLRIKHACWLLDSTASSVKEVAAALGYDDPFYFSRVFKSLNRVAPSDYRQLPAEQKEAIRTDLSSPGESRRASGPESQL
jgi:transcriptional regulator GlxA family with amidase domain